jgi:hypothetical protein
MMNSRWMCIAGFVIAIGVVVLIVIAIISLMRR